MEQYLPGYMLEEFRVHRGSFLFFFFFHTGYVFSRIPDGPVEQGAAAGRIRALEEQLLKAKEQIEMYKQQSSSSGKS